MALILNSDAAPSEKVHYTLANAEFDLDEKTKGYETTDAAVIADAQTHPWLIVQFPKVETVQGDYVTQLAPEDDILSRVNDHSNDPEVVKAAEAAKSEAVLNPVAIEAGTPQTDVVVTGATAETLAAADDSSKKASN